MNNSEYKKLKSKEFLKKEIPCKANNCLKFAEYGRSGYCLMHYRRMYRTGTLERKYGYARKCDVVGCENIGSGSKICLCPKHRHKQNRYGSPYKSAKDFPKYEISCSVPGCISKRKFIKNNSKFVEPYCQNHYSTMIRYKLPESFISIFGYPPYVCSLCGKELDVNKKREMQIDHKLPQSLGGTNSIDNLQLTCEICNTAKRNLTNEDFLELCFKVIKYAGFL